jgi:hypothetical protein
MAVQFMRRSGVPVAGTYAGVLRLGAVLYNWPFQRAANDVRGGWLCGLPFGPSSGW